MRIFREHQHTQKSSLLLVPLLVATLLEGAHSAHAVRMRTTAHDLTLEVNQEELCMYSKGVDRNEGAMLHYQVMQGDDDFDVYIRDPHNRKVYLSYAGEHGAEDRVYFTKHLHGEYSYCIDNRLYSGSPKKVKMVVGITSLKRWKERIDPLTRKMLQTDSFMLGLHSDQILFRLRERNLRKEIDECNTLAVLRGAAETVIIVFVSVLNIGLIRRAITKRSKRLVA